MLVTESDSHVVFVTWPNSSFRVRRTSTWVHVESKIGGKKWKNAISFIADDAHQERAIVHAIARSEQRSSRELRVAAVVEILMAAGWQEAGTSMQPAIVAKVGEIGRRAVPAGVRLRFKLPGTDRRVTVGPTTTFFYGGLKNGGDAVAVESSNFKEVKEQA